MTGMLQRLTYFVLYDRTNNALLPVILVIGNSYELLIKINIFCENCMYIQE
jgi:hypothetical protein